ncbi:MAG TPA: VWA domain-containing protein [Luteibaculaceae bacterium]|nr:VWA domain-containing protein [Luteibaculaceae bacterium]
MQNKGVIKNTVFVLLLNLMVFVGWQLAAYYFEFAYPELLVLFGLIPLLSIWFVWKNHRMHPEISLSTLSFFPRHFHWKQLFKHILFTFRVIAIALLIVVLARPQSKTSWQNVDAEGIDIVISFDVSASMLAKDFRPNRLESAKKVAQSFINSRPDDRIGLVVYEGEAFTQCPLTTDHRVLRALLSEIKSGWVEGGTAVGMGLATAVNRLRNSQAKSKVIILLTDGVNNAGSISPLSAAEIAKDFGIRVYTIGVGTRGKALSPVARTMGGQYQFDYIDVEIDEVGMRQIAKMTGGKYFRATDSRKLEEIYAEIDTMEKTILHVKEFSRRKEEFLWFAIAALGLFALEQFLRYTIFKSVP